MPVDLCHFGRVSLSLLSYGQPSAWSTGQVGNRSNPGIEEELTRAGRAEMASGVDPNEYKIIGSKLEMWSHS